MAQAGNGRALRDTAPPVATEGNPPHDAGYGARQLELMREAVRLELGRTGPEGRDVEMRDKALWIMAVALLAAVVAMGTALALSLWLPG